MLPLLSGALPPTHRAQQPLSGWLWRYGLAVAAVIAAYGVRLPLEAWVGSGLPTYITFYPIVMVAALLGGVGPGLAATAATGLIAAFYIEPQVGGSFLALPVDRLGVAIFLGLGLAMSLFARVYRRNLEKAAAYDRDQDLRELNREKSFLAHLLENAAQPFAVGYPDGRLGLCNHAFEKLTGYTAAELRTIDWSEVLTPVEWRESERQVLAELVRTGRPVTYEKEYLHKDGSRVPIALQVNVVRTPEGQPEFYYSFLTDISERKRAEMALRDNELQAHALMNAADESILLFGLEDEVLAANHTAARRLGMSVEAVLGRRWPELLPPEVTAARRLKIEEILRTESPLSFEDERAGVTYEHSGYPVRNQQGRITGIAFFSRDVTARKRAEEALWESERRERLRADELTTVLESVPTPVFIVHDPEATHITGNRAADELLLLPRGAEVSLSAPPETRPRHFRTFKDGRELPLDELPAQRAARGEQVRDFEFSLLFDDGAILHLLGYGTPLLDEQGCPRGAVHVLVDITARKQAEQDIRLLNDRLRAKVSELLAVNKELEGFTYSVSHDLRAPIRHIAGFAQLLATTSGPELSAKGRSYLGIISGATDKLGVLIDELLDFSRMGRSELAQSQVALGVLVGEVVEEFRASAGGRQIEWQLGKLPMVQADPTMLRFVVENLIGNAVKFTATRELARIEIGSIEEISRQAIFVKDNGVGFDMAHYDKLFRVFQRLHRQEEFAGSGIGLANVERIIRRHGGEVWAESQINEGATFFFSLPKNR